jgi:RNA polymerase sigma factor (sigma-70 family)
MTDFAALTDEDLMDTYYLEGDDDRANRAFAELDRRYRPAMVLTLTAPGYNKRFIKLYKMPGMDQIAEELAAEALFKASDTKGRPSARWQRDKKPVGRWLYGILHNVVVSFLRPKRVPVKPDTDMTAPDDEGGSTLDAEAGHGPSPEDEMENRLLREAVEECRRELPEELQKVCELLFDRGLKQTEIAKILNLTTPTLTRRKQEACERLRECLRRKGITRELFG